MAEPNFNGVKWLKFVRAMIASRRSTMRDLDFLGCALAFEFMQKDGRFFLPYEVLSEGAGCSRSSAANIISRMKKAGVIRPADEPIKRKRNREPGRLSPTYQAVILDENAIDISSTQVGEIEEGISSKFQDEIAFTEKDNLVDAGGLVSSTEVDPIYDTIPEHGGRALGRASACVVADGGNSKITVPENGDEPQSGNHGAGSGLLGHEAPATAPVPDLSSASEYYDVILGDEWEPDHTPGPDLVLSTHVDLPEFCPEDDDLADAIPERLWGCDPDVDPGLWDYPDKEAPEEVWPDDEDEEKDGPTDYELAVGDLIGLFKSRDAAFALAADVVDGFAGSDRRAAAQAVRDAAALLEATGAEWNALRSIVSDIGAAAGRGPVIGAQIAATFEKHFNEFRQKRWVQPDKASHAEGDYNG